MSRVAAIDCGTNSIRLLVADVTVSPGPDSDPDGGTRHLRDIHREMRIVRLGQGVDATGRLADEALERTRAALVDYANIARRKGVERIRMVATSATRDASNREEFFAMVRETLGIDAEVITGDEEARLSFIGAVGDLDPQDGPFVVTDVGGGSTELVVGTWDGVRADITAAYSADIGCVRLTERSLHGDPPAEDEVREAVKVARGILDDAFAAVDSSDARTWVGVAGTVTTLSAIAQNLPEYDPAAIHLSQISRNGLERTTEQLLSMTHDERAGIGSLHAGRVDVIVGGALVVKVLAEELSERAGIDSITVSEHDILDGIALSIS
ncbi:exopolyphosphatase/guanosine-5'-triphosphate,3'-diphosphate pyrophosphatase [Saccharopolyspora erythraea NRRL 2338]|uniref:Phosphatase, Ppx/GppA family n=1 Tax=Saccharopolyspora erythraea (strain ATCC 11635 / DSM 40517 / JCM 4748 / NBRC 13426 / NCIMB 8594 / NRRL 2338) TaxID=405948 RepID=A4F809_SACEN|nr:Ppx/GppA phosphatase family protein [Saccharopolyspora erythraea]EQD85786.1 exopolyphosphatase [Saccharopolyspora erythraea D]PFG93980.1 exopolyphosphatase/guanosine-5'-triphosphate,3'-diphosphate pyrophosphatase [Saccharopolyspora erythraea NRRL 2338]QRK93301.1 Ppx/GppA family phosphatase [Saccharopolyspora erythraea]CAM00183.1 phosphatase, Ppx/GppA family [Saccharopolyspora erythraea NRRL 2338]